PNTPNGLGEARQWILDELKQSSPRLQVSFDTHMLAPGGRVPKETELRNVLAILPGRSPRRIYISGHYDSLNLGPRGQAGLNTEAQRGQPAQADPAGAAGAAGRAGGAGQGTGRGTTPPRDPNLAAPGANDDGSGTVV